MENSNEWIVIVYKLPSHPSRIRVHVWRQLKKFGALYYQQGVAMLPGGDTFLAFLQGLKGEIDGAGGEAVLARLNFMDNADCRNAIDGFNEGLKREYHGLSETGSKIFEEIERSRKSNLMDLAFLEERIAMVNKLNESYETIKRRDYFKVRLREQIGERIEALMQTVQRYYSEFKKGARAAEN